jgi:putative transposase
VKERQAMIDPRFQKMSMRDQCACLGVSRSGYYHEPAQESVLNLTLMNEMDAEYTRKPYYGSPRLTAYLNKKGYCVNIKRTKRLMKVMGIEAIYQKPRTSVAAPNHKIYPYLIRDLSINQSNLVWCSDITYIRMIGGFMYLVAIMDWHSRYVLSWELSNSLDTWFCVTALKRALSKYTPVYFNTDQGSQFTSNDYIEVLKLAGVKISMDGKGRCIDNIMIERLWRSLKYEDIYINHYEAVPELQLGIKSYFDIYNHDRLHQSLGYKTPFEAFQKGLNKGGDPLMN